LNYIFLVASARGLQMSDVNQIKITLFRANGSWNVRSTDPEIKRLFGTDTIPAPYTDKAAPEVVRTTIERLNPQAIVEVVL